MASTAISKYGPYILITHGTTISYPFVAMVFHKKNRLSETTKLGLKPNSLHGSMRQSFLCPPYGHNICENNKNAWISMHLFTYSNIFYTRFCALVLSCFLHRRFIIKCWILRFWRIFFYYLSNELVSSGKVLSRRGQKESTAGWCLPLVCEGETKNFVGNEWKYH